MRAPSAAEQRGYVSPPKGFFGNRRAWLGGAYAAKHGRAESANPYTGVSAQSWLAGYQAQRLADVANTDAERES